MLAKINVKGPIRISLAKKFHKVYSDKRVEEVCIKINSEGGDAAEALLCYDLIKHSKIPTTTIIDGKCFSAASIISLSGDKRIITKKSEYMIHYPYYLLHGHSRFWSSDLLTHYNEIKAIEMRMKLIYLSAKISYPEINMLMKIEKILDSDAAMKYGFVTDVLKQINK